MPPRILHKTLHPLTSFKREFDVGVVVTESRKVWHLIQRSAHWNKIRKRLAQAASGQVRALQSELTGDTITAELPPNAPYDELNELLHTLISWRVGPYHLGDLSIDTEWRSYMKWQRISPLIPHTPGMRIADVGCSNGYFMYKLSTLAPELVVGFDPIERCWLQFALLQAILQVPRLAFLPVGLDALKAFAGFFDCIICMGVIYHQRDQQLAVNRLYEAAKPGGHVLLESLVVPQNDPLVISPPNRYARMRNAWTIPSPPLLERLFKEAGFKDVSVHPFGPLTIQEQRRTELAPFESLADFLDPADPTRTVEGHPSPYTAAVIGRK